jgi:LysM repeat protein
MNQKNSMTARILAGLALVLAAGAIIFAVSSETGGSDGSAGKGGAAGKAKGAGSNGGSQQKPDRKVYEVQEGDTLTMIAAENGVSVERIEELNPDLDPQALIPGQELKLR